MTNIDKFKTRESGNAGIRIDLSTPDGEKTEEWIRISSVDSDKFRRAQYDAKMDLLGRLKGDEDSIDYEESLEINNTLLTSLVLGWSFTNDDGTPYPCNKKNVLDLLTNAPQIAQKIDSIASERALFMKGRSTRSAKSQVKVLPSCKEPKAPSKVNTKPSTKSGKRRVSNQKS